MVNVHCLPKSDNMAAAGIRINPVGVAIVGALVLLFSVYIFGIPSFLKSGREVQVDMKELLSVSIDIAIRGASKVKQMREQHKLGDMGERVKGLTNEGAKEMLTNADMESHKAMVNGFRKAYPELNVISEEHGKPRDLSNIDEPNKNLPEISSIHVDGSEKNIDIRDITVWIDPLDATQEFTEDLQKYVTTLVCVAVKGKPTIGVIHHVFSARTEWGFVGHGHSDNLNKDSLEAKSGDPVKIIVSRSHAGDVESVVKGAFGVNTEVIPAGGAGYKTSEVIRGNADAYVHVTKIKKWDICAGNAIIQAMDGRMTTLQGKDIDYSDSDPVNLDGLAATMKNHNKVVDAVKPLFEKLKQS